MIFLEAGKQVLRFTVLNEGIDPEELKIGIKVEKEHKAIYDELDKEISKNSAKRNCRCRKT